MEKQIIWSLKAEPTIIYGQYANICSCRQTCNKLQMSVNIRMFAYLVWFIYELNYWLFWFSDSEKATYIHLVWWNMKVSQIRQNFAPLHRTLSKLHGSIDLNIPNLLEKLPNNGLEDVTGIVSATILRNTVSDSNMVTPTQCFQVIERIFWYFQTILNCQSVFKYNMINVLIGFHSLES